LAAFTAPHLGIREVGGSDPGTSAPRLSPARGRLGYPTGAPDLNYLHIQRLATFATKVEFSRIFVAALGAGPRKRSTTLAAKLDSHRIFEIARSAQHGRPQSEPDDRRLARAILDPKG
jgi:hypothetical protein